MIDRTALAADLYWAGRFVTRPTALREEFLAMLASPINHPVRLNQDIPELGLQRGDPGVIFSVWMEPHAAYEVEFHSAGLDRT